MIALGLETTTDRLSVAARRPDGRTAVRTAEGARKHAAALFPLVAAALEELGAGLDRVETLVLADGPGSFTGLRVGWAAAKALARTRKGLSVWTASTHLVRAAGSSAPHGARVLVVTSALRGQLYAASYRLDLPRAVETIAPPALATPESLSREEPDLLVADAEEKLVDRLADQLAVPLIHGPASWPQAAALLGLVGPAGGARRIEELDGWEPLYGRPAEAQARWEARHGRELPDPSGHHR
ncbi:MAG TPA: tRNA (adenosine(37)-N6)-threonylcarbamoyltransferase complex dimerization subunit type 1 TsaB [Gemmatimonadales bacterium]|jgi:tRNA threonylcarbamoyladenosine biosynthesis protein TsaB|nr:tRNA (adenosine(37)-N6)-threonylcarbamoyltransferase complex dimerization subunit type 1 TsaB [Gemmatimonadales bacterium]